MILRSRGNQRLCCFEMLSKLLCELLLSSEQSMVNLMEQKVLRRVSRCNTERFFIRLHLLECRKRLGYNFGPILSHPSFPVLFFKYSKHARSTPISCFFVPMGMGGGVPAHIKIFLIPNEHVMI